MSADKDPFYIGAIVYLLKQTSNLTKARLFALRTMINQKMNRKSVSSFRRGKIVATLTQEVFECSSHISLLFMLQLLKLHLPLPFLCMCWPANTDMNRNIWTNTTSKLYSGCQPSFLHQTHRRFFPCATLLTNYSSPTNTRGHLGKRQRLNNIFISFHNGMIPQNVINL